MISRLPLRMVVVVVMSASEVSHDDAGQQVYLPAGPHREGCEQSCEQLPAAKLERQAAPTVHELCTQILGSNFSLTSDLFPENRWHVEINYDHILHEGWGVNEM